MKDFPKDNDDSEGELTERKMVQQMRSDIE